MKLSIYQLAEEINLFQKQRKEIQGGYGIHRLSDYLDDLSQSRYDKIPQSLLDYFEEQDKFYENLTLSCDDLPVEDIDELADILYMQDTRDHSLIGYCSQSREFILLQCMQNISGEDSKLLDWVVTRKLERSAQLMTLPDPMNPFHMGVFAETATILDTMTGRGFKGEDHHTVFAKTRNHPIIAKSYNAIIAFSEEVLNILVEGPEQYEEKIYDNQDRVDFDVDLVTQTLLPHRYTLSQSISIAPQPNPFASIDEQEQILPLLGEMAGAFIYPYEEDFDSAAEDIIMNLNIIENNTEPQNYCRPWPRLIMS